MTHATSIHPCKGTEGETIEAECEVFSIGKRRLQLDLTPRAQKILSELREKTGATCDAEVIRNALILYDGLVSEAERESEFLVRDKHGSVSRFSMFF